MAYVPDSPVRRSPRPRSSSSTNKPPQIGCLGKRVLAKNSNVTRVTTGEPGPLQWPRRRTQSPCKLPMSCGITIPASNVSKPALSRSKNASASLTLDFPKHRQPLICAPSRPSSGHAHSPSRSQWPLKAPASSSSGRINMTFDAGVKPCTPRQTRSAYSCLTRSIVY
jgi:hypothetical protein